MKKRIVNLLFLLFVAGMIAFSVWGPESFSRYHDRKLFGMIYQQQVETTGEGYRYVLTSNEKLYIFSRAKISQDGAEYEQGGTNFAFIINHKGSSAQEISAQEIYKICNKELQTLKEAGILSGTLREVEPKLYEAVLYSAIDARDPRNHVAVWKLSLASGLRNVSKENRLIDAYLDAESGKIYEFYVRADKNWDEIDPDQVIEAWSGYLGLTQMEPYEPANPLMETTPYFKKYSFAGAQGERTVVTVGFYEGIREMFLGASPGR